MMNVCVCVHHFLVIVILIDDFCQLNYDAKEQNKKQWLVLNMLLLLYVSGCASVRRFWLEMHYNN